MSKICPSCGNYVNEKEEPPYPGHTEDCEHKKAFLQADFLITHVKKFPPKNKTITKCPSCCHEYNTPRLLCMECGYGII